MCEGVRGPITKGWVVESEGKGGPTTKGWV